MQHTTLQPIVVLGLVLFAFSGCNTSKKPAVDPDVASPDNPSALSQSDPDRIATVSGARFETSTSELDANDQWPSEQFASKVERTLAKLKKTIHSKDAATANVFFAKEFSLETKSWSQVDRPQNSLSLWRTNDQSQSLRSNQAVERFLAELAPTLSSDDSNQKMTIRKIKVIGVAMADQPTTRLRVESVSLSGSRRWQQIQTWQCRWNTEKTPQLVSAKLLEAERVRFHAGPLFEDRTVALLGSHDAYQDQLQFGMQYWLERIETCHGMNYFSEHGLAVADVNGDGRDDVYLCQPAGLPNRLFLQNADGTVSEQAGEFGLDILDRISSAIFVDLDNDGDQDLAMASLEGILIFENVDQQRFKGQAKIPMVDVDLQGLSAVDFDQDGDLDLYQIVDYASGQSRSQLQLPSFVYHNANDGGSNRLIRNDIRKRDNKWFFTDVTTQVGLNVNNQRHSLAAAWEDYDDDGDQDLYVANDYGQNCLYRNDGGQFIEIAAAAGVTDFGSGMSVAWGDYDRDGKTDLYVSNMFSSAGSRLTTQPQFLPNLSPQRKALYQRFAKGNSLFRNAADGTFMETGKQHQVEIARWAWASLFADVDNDGWQDLLVANGYITTDDTGDL